MGVIVIPIIISYSLLWAQYQNAQTLENYLYRIFTAKNTNDFEGIFDESFESQVPRDYLLYQITEVVKYYGNFTKAEVSSRPIINNVYSFVVYLENAKISGAIDIKPFSKTVSIFWFGYPEFYDEYLLEINWSTIYSEFESLPGNKSLILARDNNLIYKYNENMSLQVASMFKLFVLEALVNKIKNDSNLSWSTKIPIQDKYKSLPSGILQDYPNGTLFTLKTLADYMINISDNTATDHLIHFLGRSYVENFLPANYSLPFLTTAESFKLRWLISDDDLNTYINMNSAEKLNYLENNLSNLNVFDIDLNSVNYTHNIQARKLMEWTFKSIDLYRIQNKTKSYNSTYLNPGLANPDDWDIVSYKGGSDIGVYSLGHSLLAKNGSWFICTIIVNNYNTFELEYGSYVASQWGYIAICSKIIEKLALDVL